MKILNNLRLRIIYRGIYFLIPKRNIPVTGNFKIFRNIFLYFDYEREFSGHDTAITDNDINHLLDLLDRFSFKCTWFTVGQIFEKYPQSIESIIRGGHEIASHSFYHTPPVSTCKQDLLNDFAMTEAKAPVEISGFHSPKSQWSVRCLRYLADFGYLYDVLTLPAHSSLNPFRHQLPQINKIIRLITTGDDWALYKKNKSETEVLNHFKKLFFKINQGNIAGIGFHPWVLFSDKHIFNGFSRFLEFLSEQPDTKITTAGSFARILRSKA